MSATEEVERRNKQKNEALASMTKEEMEKYNEAFQVFDKNQSGRISMAELSELLTNLGQERPTTVDLEDIMEELDTDKSGGVDFSEFVLFMTKQGSSDKKEEFRRAFEVMDTDGDGNICAEDLQKVMRKLGMNLSNEDVSEMIKVADKNGEGKVNIEEFLNVMMHDG